MAHEDDLGLFDWSAAKEVADVVRYDARGHGNAWKPCEDRSYRWSTLVDDMLRAAGTGPFVAGGASMGAVTALFAAVRAPRRVQALVLAIPPPAWECRQAQATAYERDARQLERHGLDAYLERVRERPLPPLLANELSWAQEVSTRHLLTMDGDTLPAVLRGAAASDLPSREEVHGVIVPTLILAWPDDPEHPLSTVDELAGLLLQPEVHVASDIEALRRWPLLVRDFLAQV
jgi:pimeloyl-ACP methyl ester carboxylesterase